MKPKKKIIISVLIIVVVIVALAATGLFLSLREDEPKTTIEMTVRGHSMEPTLLSGQKILVDIDYYNNNELQRGDIVAIDFGTGEQYVKRVIALQNDKIEFRGSEILINGASLPEDYLKDPSYQISNSEIKSLQIQLQRYGAVPTGSFLALSDNRPGTRDSRTWGFLSTRNIIGKIISY